MNVDPSTLDAKAVAVYAEQAKDQGVVAFLLDVIPGSVIGAFASGNILQVLLFAVLFGFALHRLGSKGQLIFNVIESFSQLSSASSYDHAPGADWRLRAMAFTNR
ncbi:Aerobic C4-dicarboxylate transporter [Klebsiella variicola]|nr:Aerobic C4-dicarboxylate transporter [Klebsiella variicola]